MRLTQTLRTLKTPLLLGGIIGLSFGCIINLEPLEPCDTGDNNKLDDNGECVCRISYDWCDGSNDNARPNTGESDLECCDFGSGDSVGTTSTTDTDTDTTDDEVGTTGTETTETDTETDTGTETDSGTPPPDDCSAEQEGFVWCTHSDDMGPQGSEFYVCQGGAWIEDPAYMEESCIFDGYNFAYGCVDDGQDVVFECGDGSGDDCDDSLTYCVDDDVIGYCVWAKETWDSCQDFCENVGIEGVTYEYGECDEIDPDDVACECCDADDPDCPING